MVDEHGHVESEENFEEAIKAVNSSVQPTSVPQNVREILDDDACVNLTSKVFPSVLLLNTDRFSCALPVIFSKLMLNIPHKECVSFFFLQFRANHFGLWPKLSEILLRMKERGLCLYEGLFLT